MRVARSLPLILAVLLLGSLAAAAPGDLDPTFSSDGMVMVDTGSNELALGLAVQDNGDILQGGVTVPESEGDFMVVRYTKDGDPDAAFGGDGIATTDFDGSDVAHAVLALPDGKVLAIGRTNTREGEGLFALARYDEDGTLDASFGGDGTVTTAFAGWGATPEAAVRLGDGSVVVAGYVSAPGAIDFALAKYTPDGELDTSFSGDGKRTLDFFGGFDGANDIVAAGSRLLVSGFGDKPDPLDAPFQDVAVARFKQGGALDKNFSGDGKRVLSLSPINDDRAEGLVRLDDGRFVVAAYVQEAGEEDVGLVKFKPKGKLDRTFGGGDGKVVVDLGAAERVEGLARIGNGYAVGLEQASQYNTTGQLGVARFGPKGGLATGFGTGGLAPATFPNGSSVTGSPSRKGRSWWAATPLTGRTRTSSRRAS